MTHVQVKSSQAMIDALWNLTLLLAVGVGFVLLPGMAHATGTNAIEEVFCNVVAVLNGPTGKAIATVAVIAVGVGALLGKISWGMALIVALGVALIFGANTIVNAISSDTTNCTTGAPGGTTR
jgi:type IV secretion system protein VirB2